MTGSHRPKIRSQISFVNRAWVVTIYNGNNTENTSFRNESDARDYAKARLDKLRSDYSEIKIDPKTT
jgi:hypothetical protein